MGKADMSQRLIHISGHYYIEGIMSQLPLTLKPDTMRGKTVLFRADLNVPMQDGKVTDTTRIERITDSITALADHGAKVIVLSHYGRPKGRLFQMSLLPLLKPYR